MNKLLNSNALVKQKILHLFYSCLCSSEVRLWFCTPKVHGSSLLWAIEFFLLILHHFGGVWGSNPARAAKYLTFYDMTRHGPATLLLHSHLVLFDMPWVQFGAFWRKWVKFGKNMSFSYLKIKKMSFIQNFLVHFQKPSNMALYS